MANHRQDDVISKPYRIQEIVKRIQQIIGSVDPLEVTRTKGEVESENDNDEIM